MLGWVSTFAFQDTCSGCQNIVLEPHLMIRLFFTLNSTSTKPKQLHVRPVNAAVSRASSLRLRLIITVDISREVGVFGNEAAQVYKLVNLVVLLAGCCILRCR